MPPCHYKASSSAHLIMSYSLVVHVLIIVAFPLRHAPIRKFQLVASCYEGEDLKKTVDIRMAVNITFFNLSTNADNFVI